MRVAVISDIHANLEALEAVLRRIDEAACDEVWCLGDIVGYGADPRACLELVRSKCHLVIAGNHDRTLKHFPPRVDYNPLAFEALKWTREQLSPEELEWLADLPLNAIRHGAILCHGSLFHRNEYLNSDEVVRKNLELMEIQVPEARVLLSGHTHAKGWGSTSQPWRVQSAGGEFSWGESERVVINPGAVGQPRDGNPRAAWALIELEQRKFWLKTAAYELGLAQKKILEAGLPGNLATRLEKGL